MSRRARAKGEGSIFPYRTGYAAYTWVTKPNGERQRKYVYAQTREEVHDKWLKLQRQAREGPVATKVPKLSEFLTYWLQEIVKPNLAPLTHATYETFIRLYIIPGLGGKRLDRLQVRDIQTWINKVARTCQCCAQGKDARRAQRSAVVARSAHAATVDRLLGRSPISVAACVPRSRKPSQKTSW